MTQRYIVEMEMTRISTVTVEAETEAEARALANNLDYQHEIQGELVRWSICNVSKAANDD